MKRLENNSSPMSFAAALARNPILELALTQMELRFGNLMSQFKVVFAAMIRYMKGGNIRQYRATIAALRAMSDSLYQVLGTASRSLRDIPLPLGEPV